MTRHRALILAALLVASLLPSAAQSEAEPRVTGVWCSEVTW